MQITLFSSGNRFGNQYVRQINSSLTDSSVSNTIVDSFDSVTWNGHGATSAAYFPTPPPPSLCYGLPSGRPSWKCFSAPWYRLVDNLEYGLFWVFYNLHFYGQLHCNCSICLELICSVDELSFFSTTFFPCSR
ncbi:hypothetical protein Trydic_g1778 [Trypoxylus dichotomus]